ncbi:MAG: prephenate dehydrogenase/arogenate dehydrogenase family protein [Chloroflexota bacterium]
MTPPPTTVALLGLGLIGGSIARALARLADAPQVVAWTPSGNGPSAALRDGVIRRAAGTLEEAVVGADLVIIAAPPLETIDLLRVLGKDLGGAIGPQTVVTDVASTKAAVMSAAQTWGLTFVGGHPMAGRETTGYEASSADLFAGRPWVIVAPAELAADGVDRVRWLARACRATPLELTATEHDAAVAAISHLPLVIAAALAEAVVADEAWPTAARLAASGWASATRLAHGDPRMGAGIAATNRRAIAKLLRAFGAEVDAWIAALDGGEDDADGEGADQKRGVELEQRFAHARAILADPPN